MELWTIKVKGDKEKLTDQSVWSSLRKKLVEFHVYRYFVIERGAFPG